jgi:hypothetical protein
MYFKPKIGSMVIVCGKNNGDGPLPVGSSARIDDIHSYTSPVLAGEWRAMLDCNWYDRRSIRRFLSFERIINRLNGFFNTVMEGEICFLKK